VEGVPRDGSCHFTAPSGQRVDYNYESRNIHVDIKEKSKKGKFNLKFNFTCPPLLTSVSSPFYRHEILNYSDTFLLNSYFAKEDIFTSHHTGFGQETPHYRVQKLFLPVGPGDSFHPLYVLNYQVPIAGQKEGSTHAINADGTSTVYQFSKNLLISSIQYYDQEGILKKEKIFCWTDNHWLKSIEEASFVEASFNREGQKNLLYRKSYEYDPFGNPIQEIFTGDLTGEGQQESFIIKREFSQEGKNLLLKEESEDGKAICFAYLPGTNLVTSKLTKEHDRIILREFSIYDDCHNLIQTISDDGVSEEKDDLSHVTQCHQLKKNHTHLRVLHPCFSLSF
jgi:hypothetical protein